MPTLNSFTIAASAAPSDSFTIPDKNLAKVLFLFPIVWTAADLKFQVSNDAGVTWYDVLDDVGAVIKITNIPTTAGGFFFAPDDAGGDDYVAHILNSIPNALFRVVSINTAGGADLNQAAERVIECIGTSPAVSLVGRPADGGNV